MKDRGKTKEQLFKELKTLQGRLAKLERVETERKQAEEKLKKTMNHLQGILDYSPSIIFMRDTEDRYLLMNKQAERVYGMKIDDVVGKTNYDLFPKEMA
ncbi:MAG: PAS domain S-box protein, partial [Candidatus Hydrothermarchaeaceae archaeon]